MNPYRHKVQYYETDAMAIVHHSNYIRWMEEARVDWLEQIGMPFTAVEEAGLVSPVLGIQCDYKKMMRFGDTVEIHVTLQEYSGIKLAVAYEMRHAVTGEICCTAVSRHAFLTKEGRPMPLKRVRPDWDEKLKNLLEGSI